MSLLDMAYLAGGVVAAPWLAFKAATDARYRHRLGDRLGDIPESEPSVWFHAASVGEVNLVRPLAKPLKTPVRITTLTRAGLETAQKSFPVSSYFPFDLTPCVRKALRRARPLGVVLVELEIWPNFLREAARAGVPVVVVNGRITERSAGRYRMLPSVFGGAFRSIRAAGAQDEDAAERLTSLGVPKVVVTGNMKYDAPVPFNASEEEADWRSRLGWLGDPVLFGGSTHDPEERHLLDAFGALRTAHPRLRLVLAPRHVERVAEVQKTVEARGLACYKRSEIRGPIDGVLVLDTVGELLRLYSIATVVFIGGTFTPRGGQNMLEPAALGAPVLCGPNVSNFKVIAEELIKAGGMRMVRDPSGLAPAVDALLKDPAAARACGQKGWEVAGRGKGAVKATVRLIEETILGGR